jgi:hypothetical protein
MLTMFPIVPSMPAIAVSMIYCLWQVYCRQEQRRIQQRRRLQRERVTYLLWCLATRVG